MRKVHVGDKVRSIFGIRASIIFLLRYTGLSDKKHTKQVHIKSNSNVVVEVGYIPFYEQISPSVRRMFRGSSKS